MLDKDGRELTLEQEVSKNEQTLREIKEYLFQKSVISALKESYLDSYTVQSYYINNVFDYIVNKYSAHDMTNYKKYPNMIGLYGCTAPVSAPTYLKGPDGKERLVVGGDGGEKFPEYDEINERDGSLSHLLMNDDLRIYATPNSLTRLALLLHMPDANCRNFDLFVKPYRIGYDVYKLRDDRKRSDYYCKFWRMPEEGSRKWYTEFEYPSRLKTKIEEATKLKRADIELDSKYKDHHIDMDEYLLRKDDQLVFSAEKGKIEQILDKADKKGILKDVEFVGSFSVPKMLKVNENGTERTYNALNYFTRVATEKNAGQKFHQGMIKER